MMAIKVCVFNCQNVKKMLNILCLKRTYKNVRYNIKFIEIKINFLNIY